MNIQLLNKIAKVGLDQLGAGYNVGENVENPDGIMVRSAVMHEMEFGSNLLAIARAGAGVNNIPIDRCSQAGIVVFNTPGANANGVKELAVCALLLAARNVVGGIQWAKTLTEDVAKQVEKGKSKFGGTEIKGKTLGVIGLGAIGGMIANTALALGMKVVGCDPFLSVDGAWNLDSRITHAKNYDEVFAAADYITLHVPATKDTKNMISAESIAKMKDGVIVINNGRGPLVDSAALAEALHSGKVYAAGLDVLEGEPNVWDNPLLKAPRCLITPHISWLPKESRQKILDITEENIRRFLAGDPQNVVNGVK